MCLCNVIVIMYCGYGLSSVGTLLHTSHLKLPDVCFACQNTIVRIPSNFVTIKFLNRLTFQPRYCFPSIWSRLRASLSVD